MAKILVADDDRELLELLKTGLEHQRFKVDLAENGEEAKEFLQQNEYDVLVLDWGMPGITGLELCRWCRMNGTSVPILMLTGRDEIRDKVQGLDSGADDYLTKPFSFRELVPRLRALLRRGRKLEPSQVTVGPLTVDPNGHTVTLDGSEIHLTPTEFSILEFLAKNPGQAFNAECLLSRIWESRSPVSTDNVRVHIKRLREKFEALGYSGMLVNVYSVGYKLQASATI